MKTKERIAILRKLMTKKYDLDAYLIQNIDNHFSEVPESRFKALTYFTGFTGSSGFALLSQDEAILWTDGRYFLQAEEELKFSKFKLYKQNTQGYLSLEQYINTNLKNKKLGISSFNTISFYENLKSLCPYTQIDLVSDEFLDVLWLEREDIKTFPIVALELNEKSFSRSEKLSLVLNFLNEKNLDYYILSKLDEIAWLLNLRGSDIREASLFYSFLFIQKNKNIVLFVNKAQLDEKLVNDLEKDSIFIEDYSSFHSFLSSLSASGNFYLDPKSNSANIKEELLNSNLYFADSIVEKMKAIKSPYEIEQIKRAHLIDAISYIKFLYKLSCLSFDDLSKLDESDIALMIDSKRKEREEFLTLSFPSIVGFNENAAIIHYHPQKGRKYLKEEGLLLIDSGATYRELGTTDITRTIFLGKNPTSSMREDYTLVLKSLISLSSLKFPRGTLGAALDSIARLNMWRALKDYNHGTGHGVGFCLSVHEGPYSISKMNTLPFCEGIVTSIEPGIYKEGEWGIRLENIVLTKFSVSSSFGDFLEFENLSLVPFDLNLIDKALLTLEEKDYINSYHKEIYNLLKPHLSKYEESFLSSITREI